MTRATVLLCALLTAGQARQAPAPSLDEMFIAATIDALGAVITREYIDPDVARARRPPCPSTAGRAFRPGRRRDGLKAVPYQ